MRTSKYSFFILVALLAMASLLNSCSGEQSKTENTVEQVEEEISEEMESIEAEAEAIEEEMEKLEGEIDQMLEEL